MPPQQLYPMLLDQMIDAQALLVEARKTGLDKDPDVQRTLWSQNIFTTCSYCAAGIRFFEDGPW